MKVMSMTKTTTTTTSTKKGTVAFGGFRWLRFIRNNRTSLWTVLLAVLVLPVVLATAEKASSRSNNSIDKKRATATLQPLSSGSAALDSEAADDYTARPQMSGCGACRVREEIKTRNLEAIRGDLLRKMGFQTAPNVTGRVPLQLPAHILAMVDQGSTAGMQSDEPQYKTGPSITEEEDDFHVKTEKVITFAQPYPRLRHSWRGHDILHFTFSDSISKYHVGNATLFVYVKGVEKRPPPSFHIDVFKVYRNPDRPEAPGTVKIASKRVTQPLGRGDWVKIDITVMVSEWFKSARENHGFILNGTVNGRKVIVTETASDGGSKAPFVEILTTEAKRRTRRNLGLNCDDKMNEPLCCRYPLTVDFEEFGWDFIIAPKRYEAHYCAGECPYVTLQRHPHTHLLKMASPNSAGPCCAPRKMSAISMLYFDQQFNVIYGSLPGMVVDRCGCS